MTSRPANDNTLQPGPFVSYAREDQPFVRRLHSALTQRQRDTWVDWEGIYPTEEWMARIRSAIDAAQAFVFVISPHSVASTVCREEIDHAARQNKRIIPILAGEVDAAAVHPAVAKLNWLRLLPTDDFEAQTDALVAALDIDLEWLRSHTRLLVRAGEWQTRERDTSLLLRGADLRHAEQWLLTADAAKERVPTPLQTQFIVASRQAETRRRNLQRTIAIAAAIVLSALSIFSWIQKTTAERQRNLAISRQLATRALSLLEEDSPTSLLVSALATRYSHSPEADASLARLLLPTVPLARTLWSPFRGEPMACFAVHRDGTYAAGSNSYGVTVWNMITGQVEAFVADEDGMDCVAFGPRDDVVAIPDEGRVHLWEWKRNQRRTFGGEPNHATTRSAFSADGLSLFVASMGEITRWDIERGTSRVVVSQTGELGYAFSPDTRRVAAIDESQRLTIWDLETGQLMGELQGPGGTATALTFSSDGRALAAGWKGVSVWHLEQDGPRLANELKDIQTTALAFRPDNATLVVGTYEGEIIPWDLKTNFRPTFPLRGSKYAVKAVAYTPDARLLATSGSLGSVWLWDLSRQHQHILQRTPDVEVRSEAADQSGRMLGLKRGRGFVLWDPAGTQAAIDVADLPNRLAAVVFSARANTMAVLDGEGRIRLWDTARGTPTGEIETHHLGIERIVVSPTGAFVAGVNASGTLMVADVRARTSWTKDAGETGTARGIVFAPDETQIVSGGREGELHFWNPKSGDHVFRLQNGTDDTLALAFSPDGRNLAASDSAAIAIWDVQARTMRRRLRDHAAGVTSVAFSPDGTLLASGSRDRTAALWNPVSGERLFQFTTAQSGLEILGVAFASAGKTLATRARSGTVTLWNIDAEHWTELACSIVNRNLTREEWERFMPGEPYRPVCPALPLPPEAAVRQGS